MKKRLEHPLSATLAELADGYEFAHGATLAVAVRAANAYPMPGADA